MALRRTKLVASLGPSTDDPRIMRRLIKAGMDLARINYSHDTQANHETRFQLVREQAQAMGTEIGVIADLQGPKIRIQRFRDGPIFLEEGDEFIIDTKIGTVQRPTVLFRPGPHPSGIASTDVWSAGNAA